MNTICIHNSQIPMAFDFHHRHFDPAQDHFDLQIYMHSAEVTLMIEGAWRDTRSSTPLHLARFACLRRSASRVWINYIYSRPLRGWYNPDSTKDYILHILASQAQSKLLVTTLTRVVVIILMCLDLCCVLSNSSCSTFLNNADTVSRFPRSRTSSQST